MNLKESELNNKQTQAKTDSKEKDPVLEKNLPLISFQ